MKRTTTTTNRWWCGGHERVRERTEKKGEIRERGAGVKEREPRRRVRLEREEPE
ncbi:hypothetical protein HanIR_Chr04g0175501 [Helianthus annuus]|nr:hypothetical protein HanIR_Chr04g0175501 [Helianthus annuus]